MRKQTTGHRTDHWTGIGGVGLAGIAVGVLLESAGLFLAGLVGVGYAGVAYASVSPFVAAVPDGGTSADTLTDADLHVSRAVETRRVETGEEVRVTVTVENRGTTFYPDLRFADGVPDSLSVVGGEPSAATALRAGDDYQFTYAVEALRGTHEWGPLTVSAAGPGWTTEVETTLDDDSVLTSVPELDGDVDLPLYTDSTRGAGRLDSDESGNGVEFYGVREYRRGDPLSRINWKHYARTGDMATLEFREQRSVDVVFVIDSRRQAYLAPDEESPHAVEHGITAVRKLFDAALDDGNRAGIAAVGREDCWLAPGSGSKHRARARDILGDHPALSARPPESERFELFPPERRKTLREREVTRLHKRFPAAAQVVLVGPCCDGYVPLAARQFTALGRRVTVLSPDPTSDDSVSEGLAALARADRLADLRRRGIRTIDWDPDEPLELALIQTQKRWEGGR